MHGGIMGELKDALDEGGGLCEGRDDVVVQLDLRIAVLRVEEGDVGLEGDDVIDDSIPQGLNDLNFHRRCNDEALQQRDIHLLSFLVFAF